MRLNSVNLILIIRQIMMYGAAWEQYGRRLSLHIEGIPFKNNETSKHFLDSVKYLFKLSNFRKLASFRKRTM